MPRLWTDTIEAHRRAVREAALDATAALIAEHGLRSVTMSQIAEETGIGRATLYKYFPDVESILGAWHERQIGRHLEQVADARDRVDDPERRLRAVLEAFGLMAHRSGRHHDAQLAAVLHRDERATHAQHRLQAIVRDVLAEGLAAGIVRDDVPLDELAAYAVHALAAAGTLPEPAAVAGLVDVTLTGLRPKSRR